MAVRVVVEKNHSRLFANSHPFATRISAHLQFVFAFVQCVKPMTPSLRHVSLFFSLRGMRDPFYGDSWFFRFFRSLQFEFSDVTRFHPFIENHFLGKKATEFHLEMRIARFWHQTILKEFKINVEKCEKKKTLPNQTIQRMQMWIPSVHQEYTGINNSKNHPKYLTCFVDDNYILPIDIICVVWFINQNSSI